MTSLVDIIKTSILNAGLEVYRVQDDTIEVAERIRLHLMDSGVRIRTTGTLEVQFVAHAQRSDNQGLSPAAQYDRVRTVVGPPATDGGWREVSTATRELRDPVDKAKVLDVWYEVTFAKEASSVDQVIDAVRWALRIEKVVPG